MVPKILLINRKPGFRLENTRMIVSLIDNFEDVHTLWIKDRRLDYKSRLS